LHADVLPGLENADFHDFHDFSWSTFGTGENHDSSWQSW
jgi:hypothetical protein